MAVDAWSRLVEAGDPTPAVVDQPRLLMGRTAVEMLVERVAGRTEPRHEVLTPTLVERASSRRAPGP